MSTEGFFRALDARGDLYNSLQPTQASRDLYNGNYLDFSSDINEQWARQFLPDVYDKEVEIYGNRSIFGFLKMVSAEMPSTSDQIIWTQEGRLHTRYTDLKLSTFIGDDLVFISKEDLKFRAGQTIMMKQNPNGEIFKGIVTKVIGKSVSVKPFTEFDAITGVEYTGLAYGSEFGKGFSKVDDSCYDSSPIIMKEHYSINGSDTGQIGWIEVSGDNGASNYLWYLKAEKENRSAWDSYIGQAMQSYNQFSRGSLDLYYNYGASGNNYTRPKKKRKKNKKTHRR